MALINELDEAGTQTRLSEWLAGQLPAATDISITDVNIPQAAGMSMTTILFKASWQEGGEDKNLDLVARVNAGTSVFNDSDLEREFRLLTALAKTPVQVPTPRWHESDPSVFGGEFIVVDRAYGEVPSDDPPYTTGGWVLEIEPARRGKLYEELLRVMGEVQAVDWKGLELDKIIDKPEFGEPGIDQQLARWESFYEWAKGDTAITSPTIDAGLEWARANKPAGEDLVLNWGDARIGNVIFGAEDLSVQAVLDWELATISSPEDDLGWMLLFPRFYSETIGAPVPEGMQGREELLAGWEAATGRTAEHADFWETFSALKLSMMILRAGALMIQGGLLAPDNPMPVNNPPAQIFAQLSGVEPPSGEGDFFVGKRD